MICVAEVILFDEGVDLEEKSNEIKGLLFQPEFSAFGFCCNEKTVSNMINEKETIRFGRLRILLKGMNTVKMMLYLQPMGINEYYYLGELTSHDNYPKLDWHMEFYRNLGSNIFQYMNIST